MMRLKSDFIDYYDHEFIGRGGDDYTLLRPSINPDIPRERMFELLKESGLDVPFYSRKKSDFVDRGISKVVVYMDELAHRGDGKYTLDASELLDGDRCLKSKFIEGLIGSVSERVLFIGHHKFNLLYRSDDPWRSNSGNNAEIAITGIEKNGRRWWNFPEALKKYPLLALDRMHDLHSDSPCYIDLNTSPSWRHTWLEELLHPATVYKFIEEYVSENLSR